MSKATLQSVEKIVKTKQQHKQAHEESVTDKKKKRVVEAFKEGKAMDIWGSNSVRGTSSNTDNIDGNDYLEPVKPIIVKKPKLPVVSKKHVAAINPAAAGTSYNPSFKDHQDILQKALDEENRVETRKSNIQQRLAYPAELEELVRWDLGQRETGGV